VVGVKRKRLFAALFLAVLVALALAGPAWAAKIGGTDQGGRPFSTVLTGEAEVTVAGVPNQGDLDGTGSATITVNPGQEQLCFELTVTDIAPATLAHVHEGAAGINGPVVVTLVPPTSGFSSGCTFVSRDLARAIINNPENYYVNVHNMDFPGGALRGQLR
jgi:CHRD domain